MSDSDRFRRRPPERTGPRRSFIDFWTPENMRANGGPAGNETADTEHDPVARAVRMAYDVADEQIRQGQRVAGQINDRSYGIGEAGDDLQHAARRFLRMGQDFMALWFDTAARMPGWESFGATARPQGAPPGRGRRPSASSKDARPVTVEVDCERSTRVTVELWSTDGTEPLNCYGAHSPDADRPPIEVEFVAGDAKTAPSVKVVARDAQTPGEYAAALHAADTGDVVGAVKITIAE